MVSVKTIGREIVFVGNYISESTSFFHVIILNFNAKPVIEIKIDHASWKTR